MLLAQITFRFPKKISDETVRLLHLLLGAWRDGGQVLSDSLSLIVKGREGHSFLFIPEANALSIRNARSWTRELQTYFEKEGMKQTVRSCGRIVDSEQADRCRAAKSYILFAHLNSEVSPVRCADCLLPVPLYRLPPWPQAKPGDRMDFSDILDWQRQYRRMDQLWMYSSIGERFAFNQLSRPKSELNDDGLSLRESLEDRVHKRVYYFFWHCDIRGDELPANRPCPLCGRKWRIRREFATRFTRKCDHCRIVSM